MRRFKAWRIRGTWQPARLPYGDLWALVTVLIVQAIIRGADYSSAGNDTSTLGAIERALPLWVWSAVMFTGAGLLLVGVLARRHFLIWLGHGVLWVAYLAIFAGLMVSVLHSPPYLDGMRLALALASTLALHFILWLRTGPRPLDECDSEPVETISGPAD